MHGRAGHTCERGSRQWALQNIAVLLHAAVAQQPRQVLLQVLGAKGGAVALGRKRVAARHHVAQPPVVGALRLRGRLRLLHARVPQAHQVSAAKCCVLAPSGLRCPGTPSFPRCLETLRPFQLRLSTVHRPPAAARAWRAIDLATDPSCPTDQVRSVVACAMPLGWRVIVPGPARYRQTAR
jgi:hypothetical protein